MLLINEEHEEDNDSNETIDMLLAKKRSPDRKAWLEDNGDLAED